jgi:hypothetical protein
MVSGEWSNLQSAIANLQLVLMLSKFLKVQVCDATMLNGFTKARLKKNKN